jgi:polar amino acid transport system substrate-binding protein
MIRILCIYLLTCLSLPCSAVEKQRALNIAFGNALAPWVIPKNDQGILPNLLRATLSSNYDLNFSYMPYARRIPSWRSGKLDVVCDISPAVMANEGLTGYFSGTVYEYENVAISLEEKKLTLLQINDLSNLSVLAWQGARSVLGAEYARMADQNPAYSEHPNQELQVKMLFAKRLDVIQLDRRIFEYYKAKVGKKGNIDTSQPVRIAALFGTNKTGFLFKEAAVRDLFLQRFKALTAEQLEIIYTSTPSR